MSPEAWLQRIWYGGGAAPWWLRALSPVFGLIVRGRRALYAGGWCRTVRVAAPVIVVGNINVGGTGKTPLVIWLARQLTDRGLKVGIVSRGYRRAVSALRVVRSDSSWLEVGDEPLLVQHRTGCATVVARDRVAGARVLVEEGVDVVIADDGLQHLRLARDCEIVVIDGVRGFGNGRVLPAGPLREPISRLDNADAVVVNGVAEHASLVRAAAPVKAGALQMTLVAGEAHRLDGQGAPQPLESFRGQRLHAVAGIGNPARFFRELRARGLDIIEHPFRDHHAFAAGDVAFADQLSVLMTEKDAVKCRAFGNPRHWYVPVAAEFSVAHTRELLDRVVRKLGSLSSAGG